MRTFDPADPKWRALAEQARSEQDPEKMLALVEQLLEPDKKPIDQRPTIAR